MPMDSSKPRVPRAVLAAAVAAGVAAGSYGIAAAANGSGASFASSSAGSTKSPAASPMPPSANAPWGPQRPDETPLTGDTLAKVEALAEAKVPGGTIVRVETDADGHAAYEAHMTKADGTPITVYVNKELAVVRVETR